MKTGGVEYVILGTLAWRPLTGYEIKQIVDSSTRFFWAASYGQIYPELRRLAEEGLIEGRSDDNGGRRRTRYTLTPAGRERLEEWLRSPGAGYELRDEGLLKLFFSRALDPRERVGVVRAIRADREAVLEQLRDIERRGVARETAAHVLDFGLRNHSWEIDWCSELERRLEAQQTAEEVDP
jgi:DNA-binding PadR family transcriptional regulator